VFTRSPEITYQGRVRQRGAYLSLRPGLPLSQWVNCFWQLSVPHGEFIYRVVPDNCVDWIFGLDAKEESFMVSPFISPVEFPITGPASYFGIRFSALACQGLTGIPVGEWAGEDNSIDAKQLVSPLISEQVQQVISHSSLFHQRCESLRAALPPLLQVPRVDPRLAGFIFSAAQGIATGTNLSRLNRESYGISARQLRRLSQLHLGLSPKNFVKVARFQAALHLLYVKERPSVWAGHYYDQSHFIREFKALAGTTPKNFLNMSVLYNK
jgi:AraC-like DNA-binding protein